MFSFALNLILNGYIIKTWQMMFQKCQNSLLAVKVIRQQSKYLRHKKFHTKP